MVVAHLRRVCLAFAFIAFAVLPSFVFAAGVSISPLKFEYTVEANKGQSGKVKVTNDTDSALTLYTSKEDFIAGDESGTPTFVKAKDKTTDEFALSNWISLSEDHFTLAKGESKEVSFTVTIPKNAEPGGHYGAIFFAPAPKDGSKVSVVQRIGALILINVPGSVEVNGTMSGFLVGTKKDNTFTEESEFNSFPVTFETRFQNAGNVHIKPTGKIEIYDEAGKLITNVGREALYTPQGAYIGDILTDYIPVNDGLGNVLPKSIRKFESIWEGIGYQVLNPDGSKTVKFKSLSEHFADEASEKQKFLKFYEAVHVRTVEKPFKAAMSLSYEGKDKVKKDFKDEKTFTVSYEEQYIGINYFIVFLALALAVGLGYSIFFGLPKYREKLRKELAKEFSKKS